MVAQGDPSSDITDTVTGSADMPCALSGTGRHDRIDPKGVIAESFRIDGIGPAECRSIFLDWVLSTDMPAGGPAAAIAVLLTRHGARHPDHPMTAVLRSGLQDAPRRVRRGGRAARLTR
jgi:hypothetical protein